MLLFQSSDWAQPLIQGVLVALISAGSTWLAVRNKNKADTWYSLANTTESMARQLNLSEKDLSTARDKIRTLEEEKRVLAEQSDRFERMRKWAEILAEDITHISFFIPGEPTEEDEKVVKRLRGIREAGSAILKIAKEGG